ncbi:hypothetical protein IQ266_09880 [filamentous cyanobacterium LEGE 11480]|uniref:Uncharacterized protein n=1 Tax=Romeriopsis navalis LEGE 11480 TaxID=2777977 RepID=A0A928VK34_9CYAN|nr:hypothetical protein [Romeriopsis navalis]MBE9030036.1 hypothetical protein [Romeriopsis navalis LEGE 11480]
MCIPAFDSERQRLLTEAVSLTVQISRLDRCPRQQRLRDRLTQLQHHLTGFSHPIGTQPLLPSEIPPEVRQCFVQAVQLLPIYRTLGSNAQTYGTWQSTTLSQYRADTIPVSWSSDAFSAQLMAMFELQTTEQTTITTTRTSTQANINQHQRVIQALLDRYNQLTTPSDNLALFQALVGELPIPIAALHTVATPSQVIFLLDYEGDRLRRNEQWDSLNVGEQQAVQTFLQTMTTFEFSQFANFPTFGKFNATVLRPDLCQALAQVTGVSMFQVVRILQQAIGLVKLTKAETFLVHDICGHGWQHLLTQFGGDYAILALADQPLKPGLAAYTAVGPIALREVIQREVAQLSGDRIRIDIELARRFFHGEVTQRLTCLLTHLIGEMLADFHEFKWVWQNPADAAQLPSSSTFHTLPAKLDLSILDVEFLFARLLHPLLNLTIHPQTDSLLEQSLLTEWGQFDTATRRQLKRSLLQLHHIFWEEYLTHYQSIATQPNGQLGQIISNLLYIQNTSNALYRSDWAKTDLPFQDLLSLFIGCYCSENAYDRFWQLDEILAQYFIPCWLQLPGCN